MIKPNDEEIQMILDLMPGMADFETLESLSTHFNLKPHDIYDHSTGRRFRTFKSLCKYLGKDIILSVGVPIDEFGIRNSSWTLTTPSGHYVSVFFW